MAVSTTFKQQCPSCEAMITIKSDKIGKKVECTKCKDKFIAEKPAEEEENGAPAKKDTKVGDKKATAVVAGKSAAGKRPEAELEVEDLEVVEDDEPAPAKNGKAKKPAPDVDELEEIEDDEPAPAKNGKAKPKAETNGKAKPKAETNGKARPKAETSGKAKKKAEVDEDASADEDDDDAGDSKQKDKKKLTIGLALAGVGVVILVVAAVFVLRSGGGGGGGGRGPNNPGGGNTAQNPNPGIQPLAKYDDPTPAAPVPAVPLTDAERVKLSNLLPGDTEHVFRAYFKELFDAGTPLRIAAFETPGALDDAELKKRLGFSILSIDDLLVAEKVTFPGWRFTVLHFKDVLDEKELKTALKLKAVGKGIEGQTYYKMAEANPWFDNLSRFSFGVPNKLRALDPPGDKPSFIRLHGPQTMIIGDEGPMLAFLKVKGQFPQLSTPSTQPSNPPPTTGPAITDPMPGVNPMPMPGVNPMPMPGTNPMPGSRPVPKPLPPPKAPGGAAADGPHTEFASFTSEQVPPQPMPRSTPPQPMPMPGVNPQPMPMPGVNPMPQPMPLPGVNPQPMPMPGINPTDPVPPGPNPNPAPPPAAGDTYMTIKPALKAILDRMEARGEGGKDKVLLSSATDMVATCVDIKSPEFKYSVPRKARQFWDVTLLLNETKPRINFLGTALVQKDTLKYQLRNEITCSDESFAQDTTAELNGRIGKSITRFLRELVGHEVRLVSAPPPVTTQPSPMPKPLPPGSQPPPEKKPEEKKTFEGSQMTVARQFTTIDFTLDLLLDNSTLTQARAIAALNAGKVRMEIESASAASVRHQLAAALKKAGEKGLSQGPIQVPAGQLPPGVFERLRDPDSSKPPPLRIEREPKNRISFMAGLLPYLGQQNLLDKIRFDQSWRDPGNWMAGNTVVPQFLDPSYPDRSRQVTFGDLPVDFAATHYVGMAGVGLDAASYKRGDPATAHKRGAFSYDGSATLDEIGAGRGTSNTILMIQIPHDGITGVSPWIAGGGATLRGVPEKNSIAPFLSTTHAGKRGTSVMMADGSVRFIDQNISDDAFKAMCTITGPAPAEFDPKTDPNTPLIPAPADKDKKAPVKVDTPIRPAEQPKSDPPKKADASDGKAALQGTWSVVSMEMDAQQMPSDKIKSMRMEFKGDKFIVRGDGIPEEVNDFRIDPSKSPKYFELLDKGKLVTGSYELNQDQLRITLHPEFTTKSPPGQQPPPPKAGNVVIVLKKQP